VIVGYEEKRKSPKTNLAW